MNKRKIFIKKIICTIAFISIVVFAVFSQKNTFNVYAADTANVAVGSATGEIGSEVTIAVTISSSTEIAADQIFLAYDTSIVEAVSGFDAGGNGLITWIDTDTFKTKTKNVTFKIISAGTASIAVGSGTNIASFDGYMTVTSSAGSITGKAPVTYSTNNNLASLQISPGVLSPAFSPNVTTYRTSVENDVDKLTISANPEDDKASVAVAWANLDVGNNTTTVTVTAEDGSKKVYTIYTTRAEAPDTGEDKKDPTAPTTKEESKDFKDIEYKLDNIAYVIKGTLDEHPLPSGYEAIDYDYNGTKIKAGNGKNTKLLLMYLENTDKKGESGFYVYNSVAKTFSKYNEISQPEITYSILPVTSAMEKPEGYSLMDYTIKGKKVNVLMNAERTFCLFYGVSSEGHTGWYRYCLADETVQSFDGKKENVSYVPTGGEPQEETPDSKPDNGNNKKLEGILFIALAASFVCIIALLMAILLILIKLRNTKKAFNKLVGNQEELSADKDEELFDDDFEMEDEEELEAFDEELEDEPKAESEVEAKEEIEAEAKEKIKAKVEDETKGKSKDEMKSEIQEALEEKPEEDLELELDVEPEIIKLDTVEIDLDEISKLSMTDEAEEEEEGLDFF